MAERVELCLISRDGTETRIGLMQAADLSLDALRTFSDLIEQDVYTVLTPEGSLAQRNHTGGTAPAQVKAQIARHRQRLGGADAV